MIVDRDFIAIGLMALALIIFNILPYFIRASSKFIYGNPRPSPDLPQIFYLDKKAHISLFLCASFFIGIGFWFTQMDESRKQLAGICAFIVSAYLLVIMLKNLLFPEPILELTKEGLESKFATIFKAEKRFILWGEIESIVRGSHYAGKARWDCINLNLKNGQQLQFTARLPKVSQNELLHWLQEYLSRYGSGAKPNET